MKKELMYRGKNVEELEKKDKSEIMDYLTSRQRRSLKRGLTDQHKKLLLKIKKAKEGKLKKIVKTHCRDLIVLPEMINVIIHVHNGKEFVPVPITHEMIGHCLGEFVMTRRKVEHSAPGIGATKSSAAMSVK